ncbi:MAG: hypothetical protein Q8S31_06535 [Alphaproteobacteria bacterium]|nr:hypothetical protein [Alphaproteobacteria bacterium]
MKKLFLLITLATSISTQSFAVFEKDAEDDYVLTPTSELFSYIAKRYTIIDDKIGHQKYKIRVTITDDDLNLLSEEFKKNNILCVAKISELHLEDKYKTRHYQAITESLDPISFSIETLKIGYGHMHY